MGRNRHRPHRPEALALAIYLWYNTSVMRSLAGNQLPQTIQPAPDELIEDKRNGFGYWSFTPANGVPLGEGLPEVAKYGDFIEMREVVDELAHNKGVLVAGAPGSGKSHLVADLQTASIVNNVPAFCLMMHINSGKASGLENIKPALKDFTDRADQTGGGVVILDNLDMLGYRGKSRTRTRSTGYAQAALPIVKDLLDKPNIAVVGTIHDDAWREGRWTWDDEAIDGPAHAVLEAFPTRLEFEGKMALVGLAHILKLRNAQRSEGQTDISLGRAAQVIRLLHRAGRANFWHANHLEIPLFLENPQAAIDKIEQGRAERRNIK